MVVIGIDPHLDTLDAAILDDLGRRITGLHVTNTTSGWNQTARLATHHCVEVAGIEAASGYGRHVATVLAATGIEIKEIPTRLTSVMRTRDGAAKTDQGDAAAVARLVAAGEGHRWVNDYHDETIRVLVHRRHSLVRAQTTAVNQLRALLVEVDPQRAATMGRLRSRTQFNQLAKVRYNGNPHRSTVSEVIRDLARECRDRQQHITTLTRRIEQTLDIGAQRLIDTLPGAGVISVATIVAEMAGTDGFATEAKFAMWAGTAPLDASSGRQQRHRLNRTGNRQANRAIHTIAITQARHHPPAKTYLTRRRQEGLTHKEALRCLKRHITRTIYKTLQLT